MDGGKCKKSLQYQEKELRRMIYDALVCSWDLRLSILMKDRLSLGFCLKSSYHISNWEWLIIKCEKRLAHWCLCWISKGGRMVLIKSVLTAIPMYCCLSWIPWCVGQDFKIKYDILMLR